MLCKNPYIKNTTAFGCGQCMPCRLSRRKLWKSRILLESLRHNANSFVTLTYDEACLPEGATLKKEEMQLWLKKIRKHTDQSIRYFLVGEYGEQSNRPHYHIILFGFGPCTVTPGPSKEEVYQRSRCCCVNCTTIRKTWGKGKTDCGSLTPESAQYVAGYVTKKLTQPDNEKNRNYREAKGLLLGERQPEFARMSLRPGIGAAAMENVAETLMTEYGVNELQLQGDVPMSLNSGNKSLPLGRYLRRKLRERLGFKETGAQNGWQTKKVEEMRELFKKFEMVPSKWPDSQRAQIKEVLFQENKQKILNIEARANIYKKQGAV